MITVLGLPRHLTDADLAALARADVVAGGRRHLDATRHLLPPRVTQVAITADLAAAVDAIVAADEAVVLASGDPGWFGIVRTLAERVDAGRLDVRPGVSSVARAFAAAGMPWDDAHVVSAHGRDPSAALATCRRFAKVAVLTEPRFGPAELARALHGLDRHLIVAEDLDGPGHRVTHGSPSQIAAGEWGDLNVVLVVDPAAPASGIGRSAPPRPTATRWALPDDAFDHRDGMITKPEVRALALAWLGPGPGDLVWDVGAGSGSVAVEAARLGGAAIAIEQDADQSARIRANAAHHRVPVEVVDGRAPAALADLPDPDAVFVGGGGTNVALAAAERARRVIVVTLATVERVGPVLRGLAEEGLDVDATMLSAAPLAQLAGGHRLAARNPVVVIQGRRPGAGP